MKKSTIYFIILLVMALCCAQFAEASIIFKDSVVVSAGQRDSVPSGETWMVDYVRVEYGGILEVQAGALLIVTSQPGIITEGADALVLREQTGSLPMGKMLINPVVTTNNHPSLTVKTRSDSYYATYDDIKYHCLGFPMLAGTLSSLACEDPSIAKLLYAWDSSQQAWTSMQSLAGIVPFQGYNLLLNTATPGHILSMTGEWLGKCDTTLRLGAGFNLLANSFTSEMYVSKILPTLSSQYPQAVWLSEDGKTYDVHNDVAGNLTDARIEPLETFMLYNVDNFQSSFTYSYSTMVYQPKLLEASGSSGSSSGTETNYTARVKLTLSDGTGATCWAVVAENPALTETEACPMNMNNRVCALSVQSETMSCQTLVAPQLEEVQLQLQTSSSTTYTITATGVMGQNLRLIDNLTGDEISLSEGTTYSFTAAVGTTIADRFTLTNREFVIPTICHRLGRLTITGSKGQTVEIRNYDDSPTVIGTVNITDDNVDIMLSALPEGAYKVLWDDMEIIFFHYPYVFVEQGFTYWTGDDSNQECQPSADTQLSGTIKQGETCLFGCNLITQMPIGTHIFHDSLTNICGADSVIVMTLTVYTPPLPCEETSSEVSVSVCEGETFVWNGRTYYQSGTYRDTLPNWCGADSICIMHLTVNPSYRIEQIVSVREDSLPYQWQGQAITQAGNYSVQYESIHSCDSIITLQLMVTALPIYTVNVLADHGHVNGTGTYPEGTQITLTAVPDENFEFQMWSDGTTTNPKNFTVMQDTTFRALFFMPEVEQEVTVDSVATNSVTITWDTVPGAVLYELRIYKNGELVVTYQIDTDNNILNELFNGPERIIARRDSTGGSSETLQVNIGGLESGQDYTYSLDAFDDVRSYVGARSGSFTTVREAIIPTDMETSTQNREPGTRNPQKLLRDGQLYIIMPDGTLYDARGAWVE